MVKKEPKSRVCYKSFSPTPNGLAVTKGMNMGNALVPLYESKESAKSENTFRFIGTSETKDRDNEILAFDGWDFKNYLENPVVLWGHDSRSLPIGKTVGIYKDEGAKTIYFDIEFTESHDLAKIIKSLVEEGILRATSVGFRVLDWKWDDKAEALVLTKNEMFEISIVNIPANPDALIQEGKDVETEHIKSAEIEALANVVTQIQQSIVTLSSRVEALITNGETTPTEPPTEEPTDGAVVEENVETVVPKESNISEGITDELIETIVQSVVERMRQAVVEPEPTEPEPSNGNEGEPVVETVNDPEPNSEDEAVPVSIGDLDETVGFVIVNEEEN